MAGFCMYGDCGYKSIGSCEKNIVAFSVFRTMCQHCFCFTANELSGSLQSHLRVRPFRGVSILYITRFCFHSRTSSFT